MSTTTASNKGTHVNRKPLETAAAWCLCVFTSPLHHAHEDGLSPHQVDSGPKVGMLLFSLLSPAKHQSGALSVRALRPSKAEGHEHSRNIPTPAIAKVQGSLTMVV